MSEHEMFEYDDATKPPRTLKVTHLVFGLIYLGIVVAWALASNGTIDWEASGYVVPVVLVGAGVLGLVASLVSNHRRNHAATTGTEEVR